MSTRVTGAAALPRIRAALMLAFLAIAVSVLAFQISSILSSTRHAQPVRAPAASNEWTGWGPHGHIPDDCRVKVGCDQGFQGLGNGRHIPAGCRVKFGCQTDAGSERH
jgi:hypothetical protein